MSTTPEHLVNVMEDPRAGRLDEVSQEETGQDVSTILNYIQTEDRVVDERPDRTRPSIARAVLTSFWEKPRIGFHRAHLRGHDHIEFGSKLLLIPWSVEAFQSMREEHSVEGLVLEHVTPIDALWKRLHDLGTPGDPVRPGDEDWPLEAESYLRRNYVLAVVTKGQDQELNAANFKTDGPDGFGKYPFLRYLRATEKNREAGRKATLDVKRFVYPGFGDPRPIDDLNMDDEDLHATMSNSDD
jgi:hypothetical protein